MAAVVPFCFFDLPPLAFCVDIYKPSLSPADNKQAGASMSKPSKSRYSNGNARRKLRARVKAEGRPCAICGQPIDYRLPACHPLSYELDEIVPFSLGGSAIDYDNVQATHRICNQRKSNRLVKKTGVKKETASKQKQPVEDIKPVSNW